MRSTSRGRRLHPAEDYSNRPASAACDFHTAAVAAYNPTVVRRTRRRGRYNIIRSSLSLAPTRSVTVSLSHSSERSRIREAHTHAQTTRSILYVYTQAPRNVYIIYICIICTYIIIENPSCNPFSYTHTHTHTHTHIIYIYIHASFYPPSPSTVYGRRSFIQYTYTYAAHLHRATIDFSYIICDIGIYYIYTYYSRYIYMHIIHIIYTYTCRPRGTFH